METAVNRGFGLFMAYSGLFMAYSCLGSIMVTGVRQLGDEKP